VLLCVSTFHYFTLYFWEDTVPKIKTHKATAKRFRFTGSGKLVRMHQGRGHLRRRKDPRTLRKFRQEELVELAASRKHIIALAPYLGD
jgi:large subunit ribosomal protein L35